MGNRWFTGSNTSRPEAWRIYIYRHANIRACLFEIRYVYSILYILRAAPSCYWPLCVCHWVLATAWVLLGGGCLLVAAS